MTSERAAWLLLGSLLDWCPSPEASRLFDVGGFAHGRRMVSCPDCLANAGLPRRFGCESCGGRGEVPVAGERDPYEVGGLSREARFWGDEWMRRRDRGREVDRELARLERQLGGEEAAPDRQAALLELRDRQYRAGDYGLLDVVLRELREDEPDRHSLVWRHVVVCEPAVVSEGLWALVVETVEDVIASRLQELVGERPIRVPVWVVDADRRWRAQKQGLAQSRSLTAGQQRAARDARVRELRAEGRSCGEIARLVGLSKRRVEQILARVEAA